jgi:hypothetical protein
VTTHKAPAATGLSLKDRGELRLEVGELLEFSRLISLSESVYGALPDGSNENYYRWLYHENPTGRAITGTAETGNELVGHYALIPFPIWYDGACVTAGLGVRSLTRIDFQGRGIFARLVTMVNEVAASQGVYCTYVVPSRLADPWFRKLLRFEEASQVSLWIRPLRFAPLDRWLPEWAQFTNVLLKAVDFGVAPVMRAWIARRNPYGLEVRRVRQFGLEFDALWENAKNDLRFSTHRTSRHLNWRFSNRSTREYVSWGAYDRGRLVAYIVSRIRELPEHPGVKMGVIADLFGRRDPKGTSGVALLVGQALQWLSDKNVSLCMMQVVSPSVENALRANGFFRIGERLAERRSLLFRALSANSFSIPEASYLHFTGGDHDMG